MSDFLAQIIETFGPIGIWIIAGITIYSIWLGLKAAFESFMG